MICLTSSCSSVPQIVFPTIQSEVQEIFWTGIKPATLSKCFKIYSNSIFAQCRLKIHMKSCLNSWKSSFTDKKTKIEACGSVLPTPAV